MTNSNNKHTCVDGLHKLTNHQRSHLRGSSIEDFMDSFFVLICFEYFSRYSNELTNSKQNIIEEFH